MGLINYHLCSPVFRMTWVNFAWEKETQDDLNVLFSQSKPLEKGMLKKRNKTKQPSNIYSGVYSGAFTLKLF